MDWKCAPNANDVAVVVVAAAVDVVVVGFWTMLLLHSKHVVDSVVGLSGLLLLLRWCSFVQELDGQFVLLIDYFLFDVVVAAAVVDVDYGAMRVNSSVLQHSVAARFVGNYCCDDDDDFGHLCVGGGCWPTDALAMEQPSTLLLLLSQHSMLLLLLWLLMMTTRITGEVNH